PLEPDAKPLDRGIERARRARRRRLRLPSRDALEPPGRRIEPVAGSFVAAELGAEIQSRALGDRFIEPIVEAHPGAASRLKGGVAGPPAHARDRPRHGSIHVLDHKPGGRESPEERRRRRASTLSGVVVKKRLRGLHRASGRTPVSRRAMAAAGWGWASPKL